MDASVPAAAAAAVPQTDAEFEALVREYWSRRTPGCDEVAFTVRRGGRVVRYVRVPAAGPAVTLSASQIAAAGCAPARRP